jgi:hypothetical protein
MSRTPGPWQWFNDGDLANDKGLMVLRPDANRGVPTDEDAALIADAPNLLEALRRLLFLQQSYVAVEGDHPEFCDCKWCKAWGEVRHLVERHK